MQAPGSTRETEVRIEGEVPAPTPASPPPAGSLDRFAVVADEIDEDPEIAFRTARNFGMEAVDLNTLWGQPITALSDDQVRTVARCLRTYGLHPYMIAGLPFKFLRIDGLDPDALLRHEAFVADLGVLERSLQIGQALGAPCARVHAFAWPALPAGAPPRRPGGGEIPAAVLPTIVAGLRAACALAARYGMTLGLENVRASYGNGGRNLGVVCAAVGDPRLRVVWDPANAFVAGENAAYPDGYVACRPYIDHVHVKDAHLVDPGQPWGATAWECVGHGAVDWAGQLRALRADGYRGLLCVETHWSPEGKTGEQATLLTFESLCRIRSQVLAG